jgi:hypothetical protein
MAVCRTVVQIVEEEWVDSQWYGCADIEGL